MVANQLRTPIVRYLWGGLLYVLAYFSLTGNVQAKDVVVKNGKLEISFQADSKLVPPPFRERLSKDWETFCLDFATLFLVDKGPQGRGLFPKANCSELEYTNEPDVVEDPENSWNFVFSWTKDKLSVTILYLTKAGKKTPIQHTVGKIEFPKQFTPDFLFTYPEAKFYAANRIYRQLPFAWSVALTPQDIQWQLPALPDQMVGIVPPARKMGIFGLIFEADKNSWMPVLYATAQAIGNEESGKNTKVLSGSIAYELTWVNGSAPQKMPKLWAQELYSPSEKEIDPPFITMRIKEQTSGILESYALEGLQTNVAYARYGIPFPKGTTVVSQSPKMEFNLLMGKGIFDGFTFAFEYSPRLTDNSTGESYSYTWSRTTVGWSFLLGKPQTINRIATRFKLTPRIGILNLDAYFPLNAEENLELATTAKFSLKKQLDLGGDFTWELETLGYRLRLWGSSNLSGYLLAGTNPTKVSNQRAGADLTYDFWKSASGFRVGGMAFGYIDWVSLQKETKADLTANVRSPTTALTATTSTTASGAAYNVTFLGLGLVLVW